VVHDNRPSAWRTAPGPRLREKIALPPAPGRYRPEADCRSPIKAPELCRVRACTHASKPLQTNVRGCKQPPYFCVVDSHRAPHVHPRGENDNDQAPMTNRQQWPATYAILEIPKSLNPQIPKSPNPEIPPIPNPQIPKSQWPPVSRPRKPAVQPAASETSRTSTRLPWTSTTSTVLPRSITSPSEMTSTRRLPNRALPDGVSCVTTVPRAPSRS